MRSLQRLYLADGEDPRGGAAERDRADEVQRAHERARGLHDEPDMPWAKKAIARISTPRVVLAGDEPALGGPGCCRSRNSAARSS